MRSIDVLEAICTAIDKGDEPEMILAEDSPLMEQARELIRPRPPYEPTMLSRMDDLIDERNYLRSKVVALEESIERTFDDMAVLRQELTALREAQRWIPVSERLPDTRAACLYFKSANQDSVIGWGFFNSVGIWVSGSEYVYGVTHWMPLPQPPQEGVE